MEKFYINGREVSQAVGEAQIRLITSSYQVLPHTQKFAGVKVVGPTGTGYFGEYKEPLTDKEKIHWRSMHWWMVRLVFIPLLIIIIVAWVRFTS